MLSSKLLTAAIFWLAVATTSLAKEHMKVVALDVLQEEGDWFFDACDRPLYEVQFPSGSKFYSNAFPRKVYTGHKIVLAERASSVDINGNRTIFCGYFLYDEQGALIHWFDTTDFELSRTENGWKLTPQDRGVDNREVYAPNFDGLKPHTL